MPADAASAKKPSKSTVREANTFAVPKNQLISADIGGVELSTGQPGKQIYLYRTDSGSANGR
jgi:hypothetical protein